MQYGYASDASGSNKVRQTSLTYPNGREIGYDFGVTGGASDLLSRIAAIKDGGTSSVAYTYLGGKLKVRVTFSLSRGAY